MSSDPTDALVDAAHVAVGFGILAFQRLQVELRALNRRVEAQRDDRVQDASDLRRDVGSQLDEWAATLLPFAAQIGQEAAHVAQEVAQEAVDYFRSAAAETERLLRTRLGLTATG